MGQGPYGPRPIWAPGFDRQSNNGVYSRFPHGVPTAAQKNSTCTHTLTWISSVPEDEEALLQLHSKSALAKKKGDQGAWALPCWVNTSPKNAPWKKESKLCFLCVFWKQKRCATSVRSFWRRYRAEISAMCQKTKVSVFEKRHNLVVDYLSICEFATRRRL